MKAKDKDTKPAYFEKRPTKSATRMSLGFMTHVPVTYLDPIYGRQTNRVYLYVILKKKNRFFPLKFIFLMYILRSWGTNAPPNPSQIRPCHTHTHTHTNNDNYKTR